MLAIVTTLAVFGLAMLMLAGMVRLDGDKMLAALKGQSWAAQQSVSVRAASVRVSPRYPASGPMRARPAMRAAA
jgi:hypothetical protein